MTKKATRQTLLREQIPSPLPAKRVVIDVLKLAVASKADCRKAAREIQDALNAIPYFELGEGYEDQVALNAKDDTCISWQERIESGWGALQTALAEAERAKAELVTKARELAQELADEKMRTVTLGHQLSRAGTRAEELERQVMALEGQLRAQSPVDRLEPEI